MNTRLTTISRTVNEVRFRCRNDDCGHVFVVRLEVVRSVQRSAQPHPAVSLPLRERGGSRIRLATPMPMVEKTGGRRPW